MINVRLKSTFPTNRAGIGMVAWSLNKLICFDFIFFGRVEFVFDFAFYFIFGWKNIIGLLLNHAYKFVYIIADDNKHYGMRNNILFAHRVEITIISVVYCNEKCPKMLI